jgi:hypothetical protein
MKAFLLLVTWIVHNQPPANYQTAFNSLEACQAARTQVLNDAERMRKEAVARLRGTSGVRPELAIQGYLLQAPEVSAVCVAQ